MSYTLLRSGPGHDVVAAQTECADEMFAEDKTVG